MGFCHSFLVIRNVADYAVSTSTNLGGLADKR